MTLVLSQVESGLALGSAYGLLAIGLTMVWSATRVPDFAMGQYLMLAVMGSVLIVGNSNGLVIGVVSAIAIGLVAAAAAEGAVYGPLRRAGVSNFMLGLAVLYLLENLAQVLFGTNPQPFFLEIDSPLALFLIPFGVGLVLFVIAEGVVRFTRYGLLLRALAIDARTTVLMGVRVNRVIAGTVVFAGLLAGVAGLIVGVTQHAVTTQIGQTIILKAFTAAIMGSIGSVSGAFLSGLLLGVIEATSGLVISTSLRDMATFVVLLAVLVFRPNGLFGRVI